MYTSPPILSADTRVMHVEGTLSPKWMRSVRVSVVPNGSDDARLGRLGCYTTLTEDGATISKRAASAGVEV